MYDVKTYARQLSPAINATLKKTPRVIKCDGATVTVDGTTWPIRSMSFDPGSHDIDCPLRTLDDIGRAMDEHNRTAHEVKP